MTSVANARATPAHPLSAYGGDPILSWLLDRVRFKPYHMALLTFGVGFATLATWYTIMERRHDPATRFKGIYDYYSASYGDALLLPALSFLIALVYSASPLLFRAATIGEQEIIRRAYAHRVLIALTLLVSLIGIAVAFIVLPARAHEPSWVSPEYGRLNTAGWYHALFMFSQFYLLLGFLLREWVTLHLGWRHPRLVAENRGAWMHHLHALGWFLAVIAVFSGLLAIDEVYMRFARPGWGDVLRITVEHDAVISTYVFGVSLFALFARLTRGRFSLRDVLGIAALITAPVATACIVYALRAR